MCLQRIFFLTPIQQSDVFPPYLTCSNVFFDFSCLYPLSPLLPLSCFLLSSALRLVGQRALGSIPVLSPRVTPGSPASPVSSTSINLSRQDRLPVPFLHEMPFNEGRDRDTFPLAVKSVATSVCLRRLQRQNHSPHHHLRGYRFPFIFFSLYTWSLFLWSSKH